jgi:hypothetical protein
MLIVPYRVMRLTGRGPASDTARWGDTTARARWVGLHGALPS